MLITQASKLLLSMTLAIFTLQACTTINPYTREEQTSKAGKGAAIGAAVGAILGIATSKDKKERKRRALKAAGIGAIAGAGVGSYMDVQEAKLKQKLENTGVSVTRDGDNIILNLPGNITFDTNQSVVKPHFIDVLDSVTDVLKEYESTMIEVAGHTDSKGSDDYNRLLSESRARAVADQLQKFGVPHVRMDIVGYGKSRPIADNNTESGRQANRRVELTLLPLVQ